MHHVCKKKKGWNVSSYCTYIFYNLMQCYNYEFLCSFDKAILERDFKKLVKKFEISYYFMIKFYHNKCYKYWKFKHW